MSFKYARLLVFWGVIFVISLFLIFTGFGNAFSSDSNGLDHPAVPEIDGKPDETETNWSLILGVVTAVTSGAGFMATTIFALRDDRRESELHELQVKNLKREIEQKDLEIEKLRQEQEPYDRLNG